jgi:sec-independent protein translocase protein TatB
MFDIGWSEILVIIVVAIVVVGPKDLPKLMGTFGHYAGKLRRAAADFQRQFDEAMREAELSEVKKAMESVREEADALGQPVMLPKLDTPEAPTALPASAPTPAPQAAPMPVAPAPIPVTPPAPVPAPEPSVTAQAAGAEPAPKPKPARKRAASTKPKAATPRRGKKPPEPPHDA